MKKKFTEDKEKDWFSIILIGSTIITVIGCIVIAILTENSDENKRSRKCQTSSIKCDAKRYTPPKIIRTKGR